MKIFLFVLLSLAFGVTQAAGIPFTLTAPPKNTDGTDIPASGPGSLTSWRTEYGTCNGTAFGTKTGEVTGAPTTLTSVTPNVGPGTYCLRAFWKNTFGTESAPTNVASGVVLPPTPGPGTLTVQQPTAYEFKPSTNTLARIGYVPVGTPCGPQTKILSGTTYCRLDVNEADFVNWPANANLTEVWASTR
jgi:hypothetical protein